MLPRKTKKDTPIYLNLNTYRNLHFVMSNKAKIILKEELREGLQGVLLDPPLRLVYNYYANSNRLSDLSNMCSILDKFFCDALTEYGCIPDDNYDNIIHVEYVYKGVDSGKGRVEVCIYKEKENTKIKAEKKAIEIIKSKEDKVFLRGKGIIPASNAKSRREQLVMYLLGEE
jgi:hypothetical protein